MYEFFVYHFFEFQTLVNKLVAEHKTETHPIEAEGDNHQKLVKIDLVS